MRLRSVTVAALLALAPVGAGCSGDRPVIEKEQLEHDVFDRMVELGRDPERVDCDEQVRAVMAESTTCVATEGGELWGITVIVTSVEGNQARYDIEIDPMPMG